MKNIFWVIIVSLVSVSSLSGQNYFLLGYEKVKTLSVADLEKRWKAEGLPKFITRPKYPVDVYEVRYTSTYHDGSEVEASGMLFVPYTIKPTPLLCYNHGTETRRARPIAEREHTICFAFASDGYTVLMPDYFGLGKSNKPPVYQHAETEANASIDMIHALYEMKDSIGLKLSSLLFLSGYSQGGHASMATLKQMEEKHAGEFIVTAAAPMSGAYNMGGEQEKNMHRVYAYPIYLPYLILGYQEAYKIYPGNILEMFQPPYDSIASKVFIKEDTCNLYFANALLPSIPNQMIRKEFLQMYQDNPNHPIKTAISKNNVYDWKPESPLMLLYSKGDEQVAYQCSIDAYHAMTKRGAKNVHLRKVSNRLGHEQTAGFAFIYTKFWFDSFRDNPKTKTGKYGPWWKRTAMSMVKMVTPK